MAIIMSPCQWRNVERTKKQHTRLSIIACRQTVIAWTLHNLPVITCNHTITAWTLHNLPIITCRHTVTARALHNLPIIACHHTVTAWTLHNLPIIACHHTVIAWTLHNLPIIACRHFLQYLYITKGRARFHWVGTPLKPYKVGNICYRRIGIVYCTS